MRLRAARKTTSEPLAIACLAKPKHHKLHSPFAPGAPGIQDSVVNDAVELSSAALQGLKDVHRLKADMYHRYLVYMCDCMFI